MAGKNMEIGVELVTSLEHISCVIERGPSEKDDAVVLLQRQNYEGI